MTWIPCSKCGKTTWNAVNPCKSCSEPKDELPCLNEICGVCKKPILLDGNTPPGRQGPSLRPILHTWCQPNDDRCGEKKYTTSCTVCHLPISHFPASKCDAHCGFCHGHPKQEGKECEIKWVEVDKPDLKYACWCCKTHQTIMVREEDHLNPPQTCTYIDPAPSGTMEERFYKEFGPVFGYGWDERNAEYRITDIKLKAFIRSELSRHEKELTARFEGRMARVREAIEKQIRKEGFEYPDGKVAGEGARILAAFDQAAALKD